jgi:hypothetical protein
MDVKGQSGGEESGGVQIDFDLGEMLEQGGGFGLPGELLGDGDMLDGDGIAGFVGKKRPCGLSKKRKAAATQER